MTSGLTISVQPAAPVSPIVHLCEQKGKTCAFLCTTIILVHVMVIILISSLRLVKFTNKEASHRLPLVLARSMREQELTHSKK